jgi:hypothetical protein
MESVHGTFHINVTESMKSAWQQGSQKALFFTSEQMITRKEKAREIVQEVAKEQLFFVNI